MSFHEIKYDLGCKTCKTRRETAVTMLQAEKRIEQMSRAELIDEMANFENVQCKNCGTTGNWLVFKIQLDDKDDIVSQFKLNLIKQNGQIKLVREKGHFSVLDIDFAIMKIKEYLLRLPKSDFPSYDNGTAFIMVDFLNVAPRTRVTIVEIDGIALDDVIGCLNALADTNLS